MLRPLSATIPSRPLLGTVPIFRLPGEKNGTVPLALLVGLLLLTTAGRASCDEPASPPAAAASPADNVVTSFGDELDPDSDCDVTEAAGVTTITVPGTWHDLTHTDNYDRLNAPRLLNDTDGDFTIRVKVDGFAPPDGRGSSGGAHVFLSSGLVIWQDDDNFIRMDRAAVPGGQFVWVEYFKDGKSQTSELQEVPATATWLRATRAGDAFTFERSEDGQQWTAVKVIDAALPARLKAGVHAINSTDKPHVVKLSEYELKKK